MADPQVITPAQKLQLLAQQDPMPQAMAPFMPSGVPQLPALTPRAVSPPIPGTQAGDQLELNRLQKTGSGVSQIHNPLLRGLATAGNIALDVGSSVLPPLRGLPYLIPGTNEHHRMLVNDQEQRLAQDQATAQSGANLAVTQAQGQHLNDVNNANEHPASAPPEYDYVDGPHGKVAIQKGTTNYTPITDAAGNPLAPKATVPTNEFEAWQAQNPKAPVSDFFQLKADNAPEKAQNKDDKAIAIMSKPPEGRTGAENAYLKGYDAYVQKNKIAPAAVRVNAMMQMPQAVVDPNDPSREVYTTRAGAIGKEAPGSGDAAAARKMDVYMTSGSGGQSLNAFNAAQYHLNTLAQAAKALKNGDMTAFNQLSQSYGQATGSAAPTNFDAVKLAVRGEVAKALAGHATVAEQHDLDSNFSRASSPEQLAGIASTYHELLEGKKQALRSQYEQGAKGQPDFNGTTPSAASSNAEVWVRKDGRLVKQ